MFSTTYQIKGPLPSLESIEVSYKKSGKCPTHILRGKTGLTATIMGKDKNDYLYITKNGYHGVAILVSENQGQHFIQAGQCIPSSVVAWFRGQAGLLLLPLFPMIWGKQKEFYQEIDTFIKNTFPIETSLDVNDANLLNKLKF